MPESGPNFNGLNTIKGDRSYRPGWLIFAPFLGQPPALARRQWTVVGLTALIVIFIQYDLGLFSLALKQIQAELSIPEGRIGELIALVRLGALPAFFFTLLADHFGRSRVMILTILTSTILTGATAFAPDARTFIALQFLVQIFAVAGSLLAFVMIAEELDPEVRGWGIGALAALGACGYGLALALFAFVDVLPMGWRSLFLVGLAPLVLIRWLSRNMPESKRFELFHKTRTPTGVFRSLLQPLNNLLRMYPGRFIALGTVILLVNFAISSPSFFGPKYLQEAHGWAPWHVSVLGYFGGFIGIFGSAFAGRLSDRLGRKRVAVFFLSAHPLFIIAFYLTFGWFLPPLWIIMVFTGIAAGVVLGTFGNELFPTSYRSTSSGAGMVLGAVGGALGLAAESFLYKLVGSHWISISLISVTALVTPFIIAAFFPETSKQSLEDIAPER
ncbi:MAG: MFS transporter [Deltaproteobacteria bacterium]|nr:MFS transporter [Deltaproteobacteria bacterium]MBW2052602.1 MFS transporter [Deltaproteobacteria bacterium]MBW2141242.1 MFS transporter [Deltaproteobacteria bacterium]